ncbi:AAA family ATPase [Aeromonas popoffii]|uniref:AAA family ATPase n=1 Tax=Aeromonas popoffii TaxID=70856 RepID=UPI0030CFC393
MIKLKKVKIDGFKTIARSVEVIFSDHQSSIIYGNNGSGKTTFLKILNAIFTRNEAVLLSEEVNSVAIEYNIDGIIKKILIQKVEHIFEETRRVMSHGIESIKKELLQEQNYSWNEYINSELYKSKSLFLGVDRGSQSQRLNVSPKVLMMLISKNIKIREAFRSNFEMHEFCAELAYSLRNRTNSSYSTTKSIEFDEDHIFLKEINMNNVEETLLSRYRNARRNAARQVQTALFDTLALAITEQDIKNSNDEEYNIYSALIFKNRELIIEALDDNLENSFKDTIVDKLKKIKSEDDIKNLKSNPLLVKLLVKMSSQLKDSEQELSAVNTVIERFNYFTGDDKQLDFTKNQIMVKVKGGEHSINELSSGERHILTLFTLLLDQGRQRDFIIIDEPEISLNSKWQEALLPTLEELLPNSQIIVASHSPIIVKSIDNLAELEVTVR